MNVWSYFGIAISGFLFLVVGFVLNQFFPKLMQNKLGEKLVIRADSPTIDNFISAPIPIYMEFNFFNITNPNDILKGEKPKLKEIGPYVYLEVKLKHDLNWTDITVEYLETTKFIFQEDLSGDLREDDMITTVNPVLLSLAAKLDNPKVLDMFHGMFELYKLRFNMKPFITKKVGELLFKGYEEDVLLELSRFTNNPIHKTGRFGFFYPKNNSDGGAYSIFTGANGLENLQVINTWKNESSLDYWEDEYCNMINGTGGSQFPQIISPARNLSLFSADLCRSLYLSYESERIFGGLTLYRYVLPYEVLSNRPENLCYCSDDFTCKSSLVDLTPCRKGAPVIASTPHFYMGDAEIIEAVEGLNPTKELHETYLDVEPNTGVTFKALKRIQISMPLRHYAVLPELFKITEVIIPIFWLNEKAEVPEERASVLNAKLTTPLIISTYVSYAAFIIGIILIIIPIASYIKSKKGCSSVSKQNDESNDVPDASAEEQESLNKKTSEEIEVL